MITHEMKAVNRELLDKAMSYEAYRQLIDQLLLEKKTTGEFHSEERVRFTELNVRRMKRWDKMAKIYEAVQEAVAQVQGPMTWLIISEGWCGDGAQNIPFIEKIAAFNPLITTKYILRDEHPEVMDVFTEDGARSIPKLICMKTNTLEVIGTWGPYPGPAQAMMDNFTLSGKTISGDIKEDIHHWYARDKGFHLQNEFLQLIKKWAGH